MISVRDQPVALGCVQGLGFVGFIDEVRRRYLLMPASNIINNIVGYDFVCEDVD